jgi:hypothetical protein
MEESMLSVKGIYKDGQIRLLAPIPSNKPAKVIVTVLEDLDQPEDKSDKVDMNLFDDLVGVIDARVDGSITHDKYLAS